MTFVTMTYTARTHAARARPWKGGRSGQVSRQDGGGSAVLSAAVIGRGVDIDLGVLDIETLWLILLG